MLHFDDPKPRKDPHECMLMLRLTFILGPGSSSCHQTLTLGMGNLRRRGIAHGQGRELGLETGTTRGTETDTDTLTATATLRQDTPAHRFTLQRKLTMLLLLRRR